MTTSAEFDAIISNDVSDMIQQLHMWNVDSMQHPLESGNDTKCPPPPSIDPCDQYFTEWQTTEASSPSSRSPPTTSVPDCTNEVYCLECQTESRVLDAGHLTCRTCGDVGQAFVDASAEWRFFGGADDSKAGDPSRCGISSNYLNPEGGIGTVISARYGESYRMRQARQYHSWSVMDYRGRNLYKIFDKLQTQSQKHGINYIIIEHAKQLYKTIAEHQLFRGQNKEGLIADCVYRACKDKGVPRSIKEIAIIFGIEEHVMTKGNRCFTTVWNRIQNDATIHLPPQSNRSMYLACPADYIERFCSPLHMAAHVVKDCLTIAKLVETGRLVSDNTAPSIAAAIIFYVVTIHKLEISKEDISKSSKKSEVTIGKCYKKLVVYDMHLRSALTL